LHTFSPEQTKYLASYNSIPASNLHGGTASLKITDMSKRCLIILSIFIPLLWSLPVFTGYLASSDPDRLFLGWMRSDDYHRYGSFIDQTAEHHRVLYMDYSTTEPQSPRMIAIYFTVLGALKILTGLPAQHLWLLSRFLVGAGFILLLHHVLRKQYAGDSMMIRSAFLLILVSCGWEWFIHPAGIELPRMKNFWMDGFSTFNSFHNPLKIAGIALGLLVYTRHLKFEEKRSWGSWLITASLVVLVWAVHPNSAIPVYCGFFTLAVLRMEARGVWRGLWKRWILLLPYSLPFCLILVYILWMKTDPMTANIIRQYHVPFSMEPLRNYLFRYGVLLPFGIWGAIMVLKRRKPFEYMMLGWLTGAVAFSVYPYMTGLLYQHMVHLPLALFASIPLVSILRWCRPFWRRFCVTILAVTFLCGNGYVLFKACRQTAENVWPTSLYASRSELNVMEILRNLPPGNVFVNRDTGNKIGWLAMHNVFLGHWGTTPDKGKKERILREFYQGSLPGDTRESILKKYRMRYLWYGPREKVLGTLDKSLDLELIVKDGQVELYRIP
jgi:hypothetical protein